MLIRAFKNWVVGWIRGEEAVAAVESALVFPILLTLMLGTFDMGNAILSNQKVIRASQVTGDLITRERTVNDTQLEEAIDGGVLAMVPVDDTSYGVDIISIRFDDDANPVIVWRETRNMTALTDVLTRVESLAEPNSGVMVVAVQYTFEPVFAGFVVGDIHMQEISFTRGRKSSVVNRV